MRQFLVEAMACLFPLLTWTLILTLYEIRRLRQGIRYHRDQKGDDRCWVDDVRLYELLPEGPTEGYDSKLPTRDVFLANCARFHDSRQVPPGCKFRKDW